MIRALALAARLAAATTIGPAAAADPPGVKIDFVTRAYKAPLPLSLLDKPIADDGLAGARLADRQNQVTGRLLKLPFALTEHVLPLDAPFPEAALPAIAGGPHVVVADLEAGDLLALADRPEARDDLILSTRAEDDRLRLTDCRANVWHIAPSFQLRADGLAQYLVWKRWTRWLLVLGADPEDRAYAAALTRAAEKFGATIVDTREYAFDVGARRVDSGHQQMQTQMPTLTQGAPDHDVVVVSDMRETFGEYLPYRTFEPRPVVGTHGLVSAVWHRAFEQYAATQLQNAFEKLAGRDMTERDYLDWLAVRTISDPAIRLGGADPAALARAFLDPAFQQAGFKGVGLSFRSWDQQMRQPMLIAWARALVSISPQEGFLHQRNTLDSLGFDRPESRCRLNPGD